MFEQLDLYLSSINIGCCWLGLPKPKGDLKDNEYVKGIRAVYDKLQEVCK